MDSIHQLFSKTVPEASEKFIAACTANDGQYEQFDHPLVGPNNETLSCDIGWVGPRSAKNVLLLVSGTHGNEGWAGSAIQIDALQRGAFKTLAADTAVAMIHLINPWGCAWGRRENEDNCDLFRDLMYYKPELYSDDQLFTDEVRDALTITDWDKEQQTSERACKRLVEQHGELGLTNIMRRGQFRYPEAPCYNGGGISWSFRLYQDFVARYLSQAEAVFCMDIHTAFGDYGEGILIPYYQPDGPEQEKFKTLVNLYGEDHIYVGGFDPGIPSHPRMPYEIATDFVPELKMIATGLEFGTYEWTNGLNLIKYMNYLFQFGNVRQPELRDWVTQYTQLCYPDKDDWREQVIIRARQVVEQTVSGVSTTCAM